MNQGNPYSQAKKPALQSYLELLGVKHKKM